MSGSLQPPGPAYRKSGASTSSAAVTPFQVPSASAEMRHVFPYGGAQRQGLWTPGVLTVTSIRRPDLAAARATAA